MILNERYVVVRLITGETLMATLGEVSRNTTKLKDPIQLKTIQINTTSGIVEKTITSQFCTITEDPDYTFLNQHILFMKNLHPVIAGMYVNLIQSLESPTDEPDSFDQELDEESFIATSNPNKNTFH